MAVKSLNENVKNSLIDFVKTSFSRVDTIRKCEKEKENKNFSVKSILFNYDLIAWIAMKKKTGKINQKSLKFSDFFKENSEEWNWKGEF